MVRSYANWGKQSGTCHVKSSCLNSIQELGATYLKSQKYAIHFKNVHFEVNFVKNGYLTITFGVLITPYHLNL